jgi:hypothetical protein
MPHYHWHIEIMPKVTRVAGFEWATGFHINRRRRGSRQIPARDRDRLILTSSA